MILPFSTHINGLPTMFTNKIVKCMWEHYPALMQELSLSRQLPEYYVFEDLTVFETSILKPKLHTIREDSKDRWKAGTKIDFFINCRQKNMFRFAPVLPVVSVQEVFMTKKGDEIEITVGKVGSYLGGDDIYLYYEAKKELALNDGFDSYDAFKQYFFDRIEENWKRYGANWFKGKIIHWTDLKY